MAVSVWVACAVLACAATGCGGGSRVVHIPEDVSAFNAMVLKADMPVLVDFYKEGCAYCALLDPTMDKLAEEYDGRAKIASFMAFTFVFEQPGKEIKDRYDVAFTPTVILFVNGQEKQRWTSEFDINAYRKALNTVVPAAAKPGEPPAKPAAEKPAAKPPATATPAAKP
jgi:thioredoxin 1